MTGYENDLFPPPKNSKLNIKIRLSRHILLWFSLFTLLNPLRDAVEQQRPLCKAVSHSVSKKKKGACSCLLSPVWGWRETPERIYILPFLWPHLHNCCFFQNQCFYVAPPPHCARTGWINGLSSRVSVKALTFCWCGGNVLAHKEWSTYVCHACWNSSRLVSPIYFKQFVKTQNLNSSREQTSLKVVVVFFECFGGGEGMAATAFCRLASSASRQQSGKAQEETRATHVVSDWLFD